MDYIEKIEIKSFNLDEFMQEYDFTKEDCNEFDFTLLKDIEAIWIKDLFVKNEFQNSGYGTKFVEYLKNQGKPIILYSLFDAKPFWEKLGFINVISDYVYIWEIGV